MTLKVTWFALRKTEQVSVNSLLVLVGYAFGGTSNSQNEIKLHRVFTSSNYNLLLRFCEIAMLQDWKRKDRK